MLATAGSGCFPEVRRRLCPLGCLIMRKLIYPIAILITVGALVTTHGLSRQLDDTRAMLATLEPHPIDIRFSQFMSLHHRQAIAMSQLMLDGRATALAPLAHSIISTQLVELGQMQGWLRLWNESLHPGNDDMTWMLLGKKSLNQEMLQYLIDCGESATGMPGLATIEELNQLRVLEGKARDEHFLQLMLAHHEGGIPMARFAAQEATLSPVRFMAGRIVLDQAREIDQIRRMLALVASYAH